ncbi:DUF6011 domain-containing protein [Streptomyces scabiei]|uniref:DUF6011 domain-containing protein n=1 Tax=Streptomyces scabiei TaxID=1930 RepID=UPI0009A08070|nr:DUF6011 domain-containing protein [Streptomyces scabiei]MDX2998141.1 DUF6011 domain-containing protein [Streptomyces scabiei]MDX3050832.1 DUF6011 domain-containing protein [Streptomyces scabiei]MDX3175303.1 DUF6011 domain-containing protein [Streptomyces scabiei]
MDRHQQEALTETPPGARRRVWCRRCHRELTDPESRRRQLGAECDPDARTGQDRHDVDQDPIPGL